MINPKYICVSACVGFCLSFFVGLISDVRFSYVCLRAFIFALVFAGLSVGISFLYKKFLSSDIGFSSDSESSPVHPAAGSVVNIVVDDSNLADDEHAPHFEVSNISQTKSFGGDLENGKNEDKEQLDNIETAKIKTEEVQSFTPASVSTLTSSPSDSSETNSQVSDFEGTKESASQASVSVSEAPSQAASNSSGGIDELPDIGEMNLSSTSDDSMNSTNSTINSNDELISDSEFASGGGSFKETTTQDTDVMAKAIQTILAKDND